MDKLYTASVTAQGGRDGNIKSNLIRRSSPSRNVCQNTLYILERPSLCLWIREIAVCDGLNILVCLNSLISEK